MVLTRGDMGFSNRFTVMGLRQIDQWTNRYNLRRVQPGNTVIARFDVVDIDRLRDARH